jgi:hypothetical protein
MVLATVCLDNGEIVEALVRRSLDAPASLLQATSTYAGDHLWAVEHPTMHARRSAKRRGLLVAVNHAVRAGVGATLTLMEKQIIQLHIQTRKL